MSISIEEQITGEYDLDQLNNIDGGDTSTSNQGEPTIGGKLPDEPTIGGDTSVTFGIDLGTTYSCIAWLDKNGKPEVLANIDGQNTTPSVVYFESPESIVVGDQAKEVIAQPDGQNRVVSFIKREIGNRDYKFTTPDGISYSPIEISGLILKKLAKDAEVKTGVPVKNVVITCPAYFGSDEHLATKMAGQWAGFNVKAILNEPTAAAYAYGINIEEPQTVLVYDLGGGTFDVTIIRINGNSSPIANIATGGDSTLGGKDWDEAFVKLLAKKWHESTGDDTDILADDNFRKELMVSAEKHKKSLSARDKVKIRIAPPNLPSVVVEVTCEEFEAETIGLLETTINKVREVLADAAKKTGVENFEFDTLICVGGSSIMPQVIKRLEKEFDKKPKLNDPHECVAKGAAIYGNPDHTPPPEEILAKSYGIVTGLIDKNGEEKDVVYNLLLRNQPCSSATHTHIFKTKAARMSTLLFQVTESEEGCWENNKDSNAQERIFPMDENVVKILQKAEMELPPNLPKGEEVEVTYSLDAEDMVFNMSAILLKTGDKINIRFEGVIKKPKPLRNDILIN